MNRNFIKCRSSHELIHAQILWATTEAEKSISAEDSRFTGNDNQGAAAALVFLAVNG